MANDVAKCISANDIRNGDTVILGSATTPLNNSSITDQSTSTLITDIEGRYDARFDDATYYGDSGLLTGIVASYRLDELSGVRKAPEVQTLLFQYGFSLNLLTLEATSF